MIQLKPVDFYEIQKEYRDFVKRTGFNEPLDSNSRLLGIFSIETQQLLGYFMLLPYVDKSVDILQGYLKKEAQHKRISDLSMKLLAQNLKQAGYVRIRLVAQGRFRSYTKFMDRLGYAPSAIVFCKELS